MIVKFYEENLNELKMNNQRIRFVFKRKEIHGRMYKVSIEKLRNEGEFTIVMHKR